VINKQVILATLILVGVQIVIWFQLNAQLKWEWFKDNSMLLSILGFPISYLLILSTKIGYEGFGELWPLRLVGFAAGMISFPIITWYVLGEGITLKTGISMVLGLIIMLLQFI
jgi:hypothetical protein